jgi:hypothetical protein
LGCGRIVTATAMAIAVPLTNSTKRLISQLLAHRWKDSDRTRLLGMPNESREARMALV